MNSAGPCSTNTAWQIADGRSARHGVIHAQNSEVYMKYCIVTRGGESRPQITCREISWSSCMQFLEYASGQTDTMSAIFRTCPLLHSLALVVKFISSDNGEYWLEITCLSAVGSNIFCKRLINDDYDLTMTSPAISEVNFRSAHLCRPVTINSICCWFVYWHSMRSRVCETVRCPSVCLSFCLSRHGPTAANTLMQVCCCGPGGQRYWPIAAAAACGGWMRAVPRCQRT